jgi:hypothetical protein
MLFAEVHGPGRVMATQAPLHVRWILHIAGTAAIVGEMRPARLGPTAVR